KNIKLIMGPLWGIDLGGTKIEGVVLEDRDAPNVLKRIRVPTEREKGYEHIINQITRVVDVLAIEVGIRPQKIGIGHPGTLEPSSQLIKNSNTVVLNGMPLQADLEKALNIPTVLANDANCFAIAETQMGAVKEAVPNAEVVFGVIMGTGVGGGVVINGKVRNGRQGIAGEWGHNFLDESGGKCYCGSTGCNEMIFSGIALEKYYYSIAGKGRKLQEIVALHLAGEDKAATMTVNRLLKFFGKAMSNVINILDPDAVVLGGGVGNIDLLYTEGVKAVEKHIFNHRLETPFLRPKLGDSAGVFGAAFL
ncbi:MAG: ROK family protein, partial [Bacteroidota bacterium]